MSDIPQRSTITLEDISNLSEDIDLEAKLATGQDGHGDLPNSFFETYSAMANTNGGVVLFGVREKPAGHFHLHGLRDPGRILKKLWDELNNRDKVSANILTHSMVQILEVDGREILRIDIPRATRPQRPIYLGRDPLRGTYRRLHEGDYRADAETVKRMLAEQVEDARDARVLVGFDQNDLESSSLNAYRNMFSSVRPDHPWNTLDALEFLRMIGAWGRNRESGEEGPTLGGLLMFGKLPFILDQVPNYILDYQERADHDAGSRWIDRVTTDGSWPGNLFEFYRIVIRKLTNELKVPFRLNKDRRADDTPVHEALREALVNTLIHADYTGRASVLVIKRPGMFGFRNPGTSRIPLEAAIRGGETDCRNRRLQKMFQLAGLGEQAGSGIPKIYEHWRGQQWFPPRLYEKLEPDQTVLEMPMHSFIPSEVDSRLERLFGDRFRRLPAMECLALALAAGEELLTHARLKSVVAAHPGDVSKALARLVREGFLVSAGTGRGMVYSLPGSSALKQPTLLERFLGSALPDSGHSADSSVHNGGNSGHSADSSVHNGGSGQKDTRPEPEPRSDPQLFLELRERSRPVRSRRRAPRHEMEQAILDVCREHFLLLRDLADVLNRSAETLRVHYLNRMVKEGLLEMRFPASPNHPRQQYRANKSTGSRT